MVKRNMGAWLAAAMVAAGGCGSGGGKATGNRRATVNTGLDAMLGSGAASGARAAPAPPRRVEPPKVENTELAALIKQQAVDTERILAGLDSRPAATERPPTAPESRPVPPASPVGPTIPKAGPAGPASEVAPATSAGLGSLFGSDAGPAVEPEPAEPVLAVPASAPPVVSREDRIAEAASNLADLLGEPQPDLAPDQRAALDALRDAAGAIGSVARDDPAVLESAGVAERLGEIADRVRATQPLRVRETRLCTRVRGFGQYTPLGADGPPPAAAARVVAGRTQRAIVYVEVDRFAQREVGEGDETLSSAREQGDRWAVELTQEINLYSDAGNLLVLRHPPERVLETSRVKRRDFYLVREITLPPTLGAGRYNLKVTLRDKTSGAVAESVLPIEVVADPSLARPR